MEPTPIPTPAELEQVFFPWPARGRATDGHPMARIGIRLNLYFRRSGEPAMRRALVAITEDYLRLAQGRIRHYAFADDNRARSAKSGTEPDLTLLRQQAEGDGGFELEMSAAPEGHANPWAMQFLATRPEAPAEKLGFLVAYLPFSAFEGAPRGSLRNLFHRWCNALAAEHAYAGYGFVLPSDIGGENAAVRRIGELAMRFVGLDVDSPGATAIQCKEGIRCVNWLTAVSARLLERMGGAAAVATAAGPAIQTRDYRAGTIFQAGETPQIGDADQQVAPGDYVALGRALKQLRAPFPISIFDAPPGFRVPQGADPDRAFAQVWLARFDG